MKKVYAFTGQAKSGKGAACEIVKKLSGSGEIVSFAAPIKEIVSKALGVSVADLYDQNKKEVLLSDLYINKGFDDKVLFVLSYPEEVFKRIPERTRKHWGGKLFLYPLECVDNILSMIGEMADKVSGEESKGMKSRTSLRVMMQKLGTEFGRSLYEELWVQVAIQKIVQDKPTGKGVFLVDDMRFENEALAIEALGKNPNFDVKMFKIERDGLGSGTPNHASEAGLSLQSLVVLHNNGTLQELESSIKKKI